jgi:hypothetical protein
MVLGNIAKGEAEYEAEQIVRQFLDEFAKLPVNKMNQQSAVTAVQNLKKRYLQSTNNPIIQKYLTGQMG